MDFNVLQLIFVLATSAMHAIATRHDQQKYPPPGQLIDVGGYRLHLYSVGEGSPTIIFDHSLGSVGWANYLVFTELAKTNRVVVCDRAGYGWSDRSPHPRTSEQIFQEFTTLLTRSGIEAPYILVGNSFGGYTTRLYASQFPEKVVGMVLTHSLHEDIVLNFPLSIKIMRAVFLISFKISQISAHLGMVRLAELLGLFELFKPELQKFPKKELQRIKLSFYNSNHWETMFSEVLNIYKSSEQVKNAGSLGDMPLVVISVSNFLVRSLFTAWIPLFDVDDTWSKMQAELLKISSNSKEMTAQKSSHFVWVDRPEVIVNAVQEVLEMAKRSQLKN